MTCRLFEEALLYHRDPLGRCPFCGRDVEEPPAEHFGLAMLARDVEREDAR